MKNIISKEQESVVSSVRITRKGVLVQSDKVAKVFNKAHKVILLKIRREIEALVELNYSTNDYFIPSNYVNSKGADYTRYDLTRKGFDLLVLGLTGNQARKYKLWYIDEFHRKSAIIDNQKNLANANRESQVWLDFREQGKEIRTQLTDAIQECLLPQRIEENKEVNQFVARYISSYTKLIYKSLDIIIPTGITLNRDVMNLRTLFRVESGEEQVADRIRKYTKDGMHYKDIYKKIKDEILVPSKEVLV